MNLEDEYSKSQQEQAPQLWDRIEKNLPAKKKKTKLTYLSRILGVCAAAAIVLLVVPSLWNLNRDNSFSDTSPVQSAEKYTSQKDLMEKPEVTMDEATMDDVLETMKVIDCTEVDSLKIYRLERTDGSTLNATLSEGIKISPQIGKTYLFTVVNNILNTEYPVISKIEEIQN